jgi:hypothetical protein
MAAMMADRSNAPRHRPSRVEGRRAEEQRTGCEQHQ